MPSLVHPSYRIILIGASNLTLSFPLVVNSLSTSLPGPLEIFAAHGHGRSFCQWSYVLHRGLPSILDCGLWNAVAAQPPAQSLWGLVTDVGNDLIYGTSPDIVLERVTETFRRLQELGAAITFVRLPLERILMLTDVRYRIAKKLLFPGPTVPWRVISQRVVELDEQATAMALTFQATVLTPRLQWYGVDPIHIRYTQRMAAWREILETWPLPVSWNIRDPAGSFATRIWRSPPAERTFWKQHYITPQPSWQAPSGNSLWLY